MGITGITGWVSPEYLFNIETEEIKHRAITVEELRKIFNYSGTESENWARDVAKLMFYLIGINATDLYKLNESKNEYTYYHRSKTGRLYAIKLELEGHYQIEGTKKDSTTAVYVAKVLRMIKEQLEVDIKETKYDTDKPIVPETGKPPVSSEKVTKIKSNKETTEQGKTAVEENSGSEANIKGSRDIKGKGEVDTVVKTDVAKDPYKYRYIFGILVIVAGLVVYFNRNRIGNRIKNRYY